MTLPVSTELASLPPGHKGPRAAMLLELKRSGELSARELAGRVGLSLNAVRHHLKELELEGAVRYERVTRGVGAPAHTYRLSEAGEALFPRQYEATLTRVLETLERRDGRAAAVAMLEGHFDELEARLGPQLTAAASPDERVRIVATGLSAAGYMAEGSATHCCGTLVEHNCAMRAVAAKFPEICGAEERFLARTLGGTIERKAHILDGACACSYKVRFRTEENG